MMTFLAKFTDYFKCQMWYPRMDACNGISNPSVLIRVFSNVKLLRLEINLD